MPDALHALATDAPERCCEERDELRAEVERLRADHAKCAGVAQALATDTGILLGITRTLCSLYRAGYIEDGAHHGAQYAAELINRAEKLLAEYEDEFEGATDG